METTETTAAEVSEESPAVENAEESQEATETVEETTEGGEEGADKEPGTSEEDLDAEAKAEQEGEESAEKSEKQEKEELGPEIDTKIASLVNNMMRSSLDHDKMRSLAKKCRRPGNTENLSTPRVNPKVMHQLLDGKAKGDDLKLQFMQRTLCQGMSPMVYMLDTLFKVKKGDVPSADVDMSEMLAQCTDSLTMLSQCYSSMNFNRRNLLLPYFHETSKVPYKRQVMKETVQTGYLFSENIEKAISDGKLKRRPNTGGDFRPRGGRGGQHSRSFSSGSGGGYNRNAGGWRRGGRGGRGRPY